MDLKYDMLNEIHRSIDGLKKKKAHASIKGGGGLHT